MAARLRRTPPPRKDDPGDLDPGAAEWLVWRDRASVLRFAGYSGAMSTTVLSDERSAARRVAEGTAFSIILALGFSHFLNDMMQSLLPALYPMLKGAYGLSFAQIGLITLTSQLISSVLQPAAGLFADHRTQPFSLAVGMGVTFIGLLFLAR